MKKIGIIYKREDELIVNTAKQLVSDLAADYKVLLDEKKFKGLEFIITLGGDGTILRASKIATKMDIPILSVNLGGLGLMSEIMLNEISVAVSKIKAKKFKIDKRMMLEVGVATRSSRGIKTIKKSLALNDVVIGKNEIARTIKLEAYLSERLIASYVGDGLIISTPTGSTAYNFAVMGPILPPNAHSFILSPICPHRAANRSIVLNNPVLVRLVKGQEILLTIDGQTKISLLPGDFVSVKPSKLVTKLIRFKDYDLWGLLRAKMGWS
ncbi:MAG: NAD(+)/NADH kinase [Candidatus Saganbacteria bacterium]|nr:NAD(+)/NADH kinase [Candidatus Saganbacteria bacterium]